MDYDHMTHDQLIRRVKSLEKQLKAQTLSAASDHAISISAPSLIEHKNAKEKKSFDFSKYNTRFIALKFAYLGQRYNGYEYHANTTTPLPTVEEVLWKALMKTKLISPTEVGQVSWEGCDYAKCGRTDKGVSAFGQVVSLRVRSNKPKQPPAQQPDDSTVDKEEHEVEGEQPFDDIVDEIPYPRLLNRVLPNDIRVLAWCPSIPPDFSARFSCRERRYRYFFTQPAYSPRSDMHGLRHLSEGVRRDGWLDIGAMRDAARYYVGVHDFRNFCKIDPARQLTNFERRVAYADIEEAPSSSGVMNYVKQSGYASLTPEDAKVYTFTVHGSAFLYHQVRHMVAMLFLVGLGLEKPSIIQDLLDIHRNPTKPMYEMADDAPLVLWDCVFPDLEKDEQAPPEKPKQDALHWIYPDQQPEKSRGNVLVDNNGRFGPGGVQDVCWSNWRQRKIDEVVAASLLDLVAMQCGPQQDVVDDEVPYTARSTRIFDGGNNYRFKGEYTPVLKRERMDTVAVLNARYLERKRLAQDAASEVELP